MGMLLAMSADAGTALIAIAFIVLPLAGMMFAEGSSRRYDEIGKGGLTFLDGDSDRDDEAESAAVREEEIRQMVQAKSDRGVDKGADPLDVDAEVEKLLADSN